jgi:Chitobiase/beta-hexosaminidase C-terminal domain/Fn3 associated
VTISDSAPGASIYYTTDGSTPSTSSTLYTGPISVSSTTTLTTIATLAGWANSPVGSATYTITIPPPATPTLSPTPGTYSTTQTVTISDSTAGASIYYTTDGSTPTTASMLYAGPLSVTQTATIKAIASTGGPSSGVASGTYTLRVATPVFSLAAGTYNSAQSVTISDSNPGASIYYTIDGSTPTASSTPYAGPVSVTQTTTIKAVSVLTGWSSSAVASGTYTLKVPSPTFNPPAGTYKGAQSIAIADALPGVSIYYTVNGASPTTSSALYTGPILISSTRTIKAIAAVAGWSNSSAASANYTIH